MKTIFKGIGFGLGFYVGKMVFDIGTVVVARKLLAKGIEKTLNPDK